MRHPWLIRINLCGIIIGMDGDDDVFERLFGDPTKSLRSGSPTDWLQKQLRDARRRRGWSQQRLSSRLDELGVALDQSSIARIERGKRGVSLDDAVHLAVALDMPLVALITPQEEGAVALTPKLRVRGAPARRWIRGHAPTEGMDTHQFFASAPFDERDAVAHLGYRELRDSLDALAMYVGARDIENQLDELRLMRDEIARRERALQRQRRTAEKKPRKKPSKRSTR